MTAGIHHDKWGRLSLEVEAIVAKRVENIRNEISAMADSVVEQMEQMYSDAMLGSPGNTDGYVEKTGWKGDTLYIEVGGSIIFVEFGTGIFQSGTEIGNKYGLGPASYSRAHAGEDSYATVFPNGHAEWFSTGGWLVPPKVEAFHGYWPLPNGVTASSSAVQVRRRGNDTTRWVNGSPPVDAVGWARRELEQQIASKFNGR